MSTFVRLGLNLGYWGAGNDASNLALAKEADTLGYSVVWVAEAYGSDAPTVLAWIAAQTARNRHRQCGPADPGAHSRDDGDDRRHLGHALRRDGSGSDSASRARRCRRAGTASGSPRHWAAPASTWTSCGPRCVGRRCATRASFSNCRCPTAPARRCTLTVHPVRERIPIYLAAIGPKNLELTGEIADGWLPVVLLPEYASDPAGTWQAGRGRAGRDLAGFDVAPTVPFVLGDDWPVCADSVRAYAALTWAVWAAGSRTSTTNWRCGWASPTPPREVQERYLAKATCEAAAAVPLEFLDSDVLLGPRSGSPSGWPRSPRRG